MQVEATGSKELDLAEDMGSASKQEQPAEAEPAKQPATADQITSDSVHSVPESLPAQSAPARFSEVAASSNGFPRSPQPLPDQLSGTTHEQQELLPPAQTTAAAQAPAPAAQEEEPWQEVRTSRRKLVSQQAASKASTHKARKHGRGAPDLGNPAPSALGPSSFGQAAAQPAGKALLSSDRTVVPPHPEARHEAAQHCHTGCLHWIASLSSL